MEELGWPISQQRGGRWGWRILVGEVRPELSADGGERVAEGGFGLGYQAVCRVEAVGMRGMRHEHDDADEAEEAGRGAADGAGGPLVLGLQAEMRPGFLEGDFDVPSQDVGGQDGRGIDRLVGAKERVR